MWSPAWTQARRAATIAPIPLPVTTVSSVPSRELIRASTQVWFGLFPYLVYRTSAPPVGSLWKVLVW